MPIADPPDQVQMHGDVSIFDESFERSLINIVPEELRGAMLRVKHAHEKYFLLEERDLWKITKPTEVSSILKLSFWDEYNRAQDAGSRMKISNIIRGACSRDFFYTNVMHNDKQFSWIITPPKDYMLNMRALHEKGVSKLNDVLDLPLLDGKGQPNVRLIGEVFKITQYLDQRIKGAIVQRFAIQQQNVNMNVAAPLEATSLEDLEKLERGVAIAKAKAQGALPAAITIDVGEDGKEGTPAGPVSPIGSDQP